MAINANLKRMTTADKAIGAGLLVMLIASFLPWISVSLGNVLGTDLGSVSVNGYHSWGFLFWVATYALIAFWVIRVLVPEMVPMPALPVHDALIYIIGGLVALIGALLYQVHDGGSFTNIGFGWYIALLGVVTLIAGGVLKQKDPRSIAGGGYGAQAGSYGGPQSSIPPHPGGPGGQYQPPAPRQMPQGPAQTPPQAYPQTPPQQPYPQPAPPQQPYPQPAPPQQPYPQQPPAQGIPPQAPQQQPPYPPQGPPSAGPGSPPPPPR